MSPVPCLTECEAANKALPIEWLAGTFSGAPAAELNLAQSLAFGDNPCGNDEPLTTFAERGMCFVSVAAGAADALPAALRPFHVGGLETGTARVLQCLLQTDGATKVGEAVRGICAAVRAAS